MEKTFQTLLEGDESTETSSSIGLISPGNSNPAFMAGLM
jgi:hypothetical protein